MELFTPQAPRARQAARARGREVVRAGGHPPPPQTETPVMNRGSHNIACGDAADVYEDEEQAAALRAPAVRACTVRRAVHALPAAAKPPSAGSSKCASFAGGRRAVGVCVTGTMAGPCPHTSPCPQGAPVPQWSPHRAPVWARDLVRYGAPISLGGAGR
jgi:hypothetical protein